MSIPLSPPSAKYVLAVYGGEPVQLPWSSPLLPMMNIRVGHYSESKAKYQKRKKETLTVELDFELGDRLAKRANENRWAIGFCIHGFFYEVLTQWVRAQRSLPDGPSIPVSINSFYKAHGVNLYDLDVESACKRYARFMDRVNKQGIKVDKMPEELRKSLDDRRLSLEECEQAALAVLHYLDIEGVQLSRKQLVFFLVMAYSFISAEEIAAHFKAQTRAVYRAHKKVGRIYNFTPAFAQLVDGVVRQLRGPAMTVLSAHLPVSAFSQR